MSSYGTAKPVASHRVIDYRNHFINSQLQLVVNLLPITPGAPSTTRVVESDGTRNRCKPAITFAELLLSAKKGHLWWNGHRFVCKSPLQKPKLARQFLQRYGSNLWSCMLL